MLLRLVPPSPAGQFALLSQRVEEIHPSLADQQDFGLGRAKVAGRHRNVDLGLADGEELAAHDVEQVSDRHVTGGVQVGPDEEVADIDGGRHAPTAVCL